MPTPVATIANLTATGDVIIGPGAVTDITMGLPDACMGDAVAGPMVATGVITLTLDPTVIKMGRPVGCMGSLVVGVSPPMPVPLPMATAVAICPNVNVIV
jgi:hypothetical protein